jgi:hypothetical protein
MQRIAFHTDCRQLPSPENTRLAPIEDGERPSKSLKTAAANSCEIDLASLFPGPRFLVGTGKTSHIIDLAAQDKANKRLFLIGGDHSAPRYANAYWNWFCLQHTYPPELAIFDKEPARKQELSNSIRGVRVVLKFDHGACSLRRKEIIGKLLSELEEEYHILALRPLHYTIRFDGYEFKVYGKDYRKEIDVNETDDEEDTDDVEDDGYDTEQDEYEAGVDFAHNDDEGLADMYL